VYSADGETKEFNYVSSAFERILGYTLEDIKKMERRVAFLSKVQQEVKFSEYEKIFDQFRSQKIVKQYCYEKWWSCTFLFSANRS